MSDWVRISQSDVEAIEKAAEALIRSGDTDTAITLLALALRLWSETGLLPRKERDVGVT